MLLIRTMPRIVLFLALMTLVLPYTASTLSLVAAAGLHSRSRCRVYCIHLLKTFLFSLRTRRRVPPRRAPSIAQRSGRLALGSLKMVNQVYRQVVRNEISAERASDTSSDGPPNSKLIYPLWTSCAIAFCLSATIDFPYGIWDVPVDMFIV